MMRWLVLILSLLLSTTPVGAVTITSGSVGAWQGGDFGGAWDLHGAGYDLVTFHHGSNEPVSFAVYTSGGQYGVPRDLSHTVQQGFGQPAPPGYIVGQITWTIDPVTVHKPDPQPGIGHPLSSGSAPFTMTGVLNGTDVDGRGIFTLTTSESGATSWHVWAVNFTFQEPAVNGLAPVPEPATWALVGVGAVAAGLWRWRRAT